MLDRKKMKQDPQGCLAALKRRGVQSLEPLERWDTLRKEHLEELERLGQQKNSLSQQMYEKREDKEALVEALRQLHGEMAKAQTQLAEAQEGLEQELKKLPNLPLSQVPEQTQWQPAKGQGREFPYHPKSAKELWSAMEWKIVEKDKGTYVGAGARLERKLISYVLDGLESQGAQEETLESTSCWQKQLMERLEGKILTRRELPLGRCGWMRQPQGDSLFGWMLLCPESQREAYLDHMTLWGENLLQELGLKCRRGSVGISQLKQEEGAAELLQVWMPSQERFLTVGRCSDTGDYQISEHQIRGKEPQKGRMPLAGLFLTLEMDVLWQAILEQGQQEEGTVLLPPWAGGELCFPKRRYG